MNSDIGKKATAMTNHYLRIEGVNHAAVMEDTTQLSVIRGGSFRFARP